MRILEGLFFETVVEKYDINQCAFFDPHAPQ